MEAHRQSALDLLVLKVLPAAVHCREIGAGPLTYRRKLPAVVPGQRLTIVPERRWIWRKTDMVGGELVSIDFSLRAIQQAGYGRTRHVDGALISPGDTDARLREGILENEGGNWIVGRCLLLDVLEDEPGNLLAHATLGEIYGRLSHVEIAAAHHTAAIRLGLGALVHDESLPLDPRGETERALLRSLVARAEMLAEAGRKDAAAADLRRAMAWDPTDCAGAGIELARLVADVAEGGARARDGESATEPQAGRQEARG